MDRFQNFVLDLLVKFPPPGKGVASVLMLVAMTLYGTRRKLSEGLQPALVSFEFVRSAAAAITARRRWKRAGVRRARRAIIIDFFLLPVWTALIVQLCLSASVSVRHDVPWLAVIGTLIAWLSASAVLFGWAEDSAMLAVLGGARKLVMMVRLCARAKYWLLAVPVPFVVFCLQYLIYQRIERQADTHPAIAISLLLVLTAIVGTEMLRRSAMLHPSLLMLQLARSVEDANRVLTQWGASGRERAITTNMLGGVLALLYAETLAVVCFHIAAVHPGPWLPTASRCIGWYMILAGSCHVAQNVGAHAAIRLIRMGWWFKFCRFCGRLRMALLFVGGLWLGLLFLGWEARKLGSIPAPRGSVSATTWRWVRSLW